jgi:hypothetical protein
MVYCLTPLSTIFQLYRACGSQPITTKVGSSSPVHGQVYSIQHYMIKFVSDLWQFCGSLWFPPPIKLTSDNITDKSWNIVCRWLVKTLNFVCISWQGNNVKIQINMKLFQMAASHIFFLFLFAILLRILVVGWKNLILFVCLFMVFNTTESSTDYIPRLIPVGSL